jgi:hypothetical protein
MKIKKFVSIGLLSLVFLGIAHTSAEARHHRRSSFSLNVGVGNVAPVYAAPVYVAPVYPAPVVEYYAPAPCEAPVYARQVVYPTPVYAAPVYVAPRVPVYRQTSFSWFFGW